MHEREKEPMSDATLDALLESGVDGLPPGDVVAGVTPWKKAMRQVLLGLALTTLTMDIRLLNEILPAVGMVLALLGFRSLRQENSWFRRCFIITLLRAGYLYVMLILGTTILSDAIADSSAVSALRIVMTALVPVELFCLWRALQAVQRQAGLEGRVRGGAALLVWCAVVWLLAYMRYSGGFLLLIVLLVCYISIFYNLYSLSLALDEAGYAIAPKPVRVTDRGVAIVIAAVVLAGCACGYLFGNRYPMDWRAVEETAHGSDVESQLLALGFPETVLRDLAPDDLAACDGALAVVTDTWEESTGDGGQLYLTNVIVQVAGELDRWMVFHHFRWTTKPGFCGTESIRLQTVDQWIPVAWATTNNVTGRVLYDDGGATYAAPYHSLSRQMYVSESVVWGEQTNADIFATFSLPWSGENCRGYLAYSAVRMRETYIFNDWLYYTHQQSWKQYPAITATEYQMQNGMYSNDVFQTITFVYKFYQPAVESEKTG